MTPTNERLAAAVAAFHRATGDAEKRVASIISALSAYDAQHAGDVSDAAVDSFGDEWSASGFEWPDDGREVFKRLLRAALPHLALQTQPQDDPEQRKIH